MNRSGGAAAAFRSESRPFTLQAGQGASVANDMTSAVSSYWA